MLRILRAFVWLRWRTLMNSFEHTGSRDVLERFSIGVEQIAPILAFLLIVPSALLLSALAAAAGFSLARGEQDAIALQASRYLLLLLPAVVVVGPIIMPGSHRPNPVRLLLLPIPRSTLYLAHVASAFSEPWHVLAVPMTLSFAAGLLAGGDPFAALLTAAAALALVAVLVGLSALVTSALQLLFRDRRRGELVALVFIVFIPLASMVPAMFVHEERSRIAARSRSLPGWVRSAGETAMALLPPQMFLDTASGGAGGDPGRSARSLAGLALATALVHAIGFVSFRRVLDSPASSGARRGAQVRPPRSWRVPGLRPGPSAVALAHVRLALRTPRGRSILLSPLILFGFIAIFAIRGSGGLDLGPFDFANGVGLAAMTSFFCVLSTLPISTNQFAVDGAGLTMTLLSPLTERELLLGKAIGNSAIGLAPALFCILGSAIVVGGGSMALWAAIPLGIVAVCALAMPMLAIASAVFPKTVELNSIGSNNAHGLAALIGMVSLVVAAAPPTLLALVAAEYFDRPFLALVLVAAWSAIALLLARPMFTLAARVFRARRENLAMRA